MKLQYLPYVLFGAVFLGVMSYFAYAMAFSYSRQKAAAEVFRPVEATVVSSRVHESTTGSGSGRAVSYRPEVVYEYTVGGSRHRSDRYWFTGTGPGSYDEADAIVGRFEPGETVTAYYDPADPSTAVLDRTAPSAVPFVTVLPLLFLAGIGVTIAGFVVRRRRQGAAAEPTTVAATGEQRW